MVRGGGGGGDARWVCMVPGLVIGLFGQLACGGVVAGRTQELLVGEGVVIIRPAHLASDSHQIPSEIIRPSRLVAAGVKLSGTCTLTQRLA